MPKNVNGVAVSAGRATHPDQLGERMALQLFHDACLVDFDGTRADRELRSNLAVLMPGGEQRQYLALARSEPRKSRVDTQYRRT